MDLDGKSQRYGFNLAQVHIPVLTTLIILYRSQSIFCLSVNSAPSIAAANLAYRIFEAIQLRAETKYLGSAFAWYLLVTSIPLLSCLAIPGMRMEACASLDTLEECLQSLAAVRPAAANNLKSVKVIRSAISSSRVTSVSVGPVDNVEEESVKELLAIYGEDTIEYLVKIQSAIRNSNDAATVDSLLQHSPTETSLPHQQDTVLLENPGADSANRNWSTDLTHQRIFTGLFHDETLTDSWMTRDWMIELQNFGE